MDWQLVAQAIIRQLKQQYLLPWQIDQDWTTEISTGYGDVVVKCRNYREARQVVELATGATTEIPDWQALADRLLSHLIVEHKIPWRLVPARHKWEVVASDDAILFDVVSEELGSQVIKYSFDHEIEMVIVGAEQDLLIEAYERQDPMFDGFSEWLNDRKKRNPGCDTGLGEPGE